MSDVDDTGVTRCAPADVEELRAFQRRLYGASNRVLDPRRSAWLFERNPARWSPAPTVWLCRRRGRIVGTQAAIAVPLVVDGVLERAYWGVDLMVDPAWRGRGVAGAVGRVIRAECRASCALSVSEAAVRSLLRRGSTDLGPVPMYFRLLRAGGTRHWLGAPRPVARAGRLAAVPALALLDTVAGARALRTRAVPVDAFDDRVDDVWRAVAPEFRVLARRDGAWLRWRFDEGPERGSYRRFLVERRGIPVGYLVLRRSTWNGRPALSLVDYLAGRADLAAVWAHAVRLARHDGAEALLCDTLHPRARRTLAALGFVRRRHQGIGFMVFTHPGDPLRSVLHDRRHWFLTRADSDVD